ncbi:MAG: cytochrome c3 family protein [Dermatophilaceae bacterium]
MKERLAVLAACSTLVFSFGAAAPAFADNGPHVAGAGIVTDRCATCHRVHTAKAGNLLTEAQSTLCYTCHGSTGTGATTDVKDGTGYAAGSRVTKTGALRGGGFSYALIDSANPGGQLAGSFNSTGTIGVLAAGATVTSAHTVDGTSATAWGNGAISTTANYGATIQLTCGSCHDPHGNGNYRILRDIPRQSGVIEPAGVTLLDSEVPNKVYTTTNYWQAADTNAPSYFIQFVSNWCATCHTRYLAGTNSGSTASGDAVYAYRHTSNATTAGGPTCIQCHVAHGSNASMGTVSGAVGDPGGAGTAGDSKLLRIDNRGTCQMCHNR